MRYNLAACIAACVLSFSAVSIAQTAPSAAAVQTATPIKHLVVIFQENVSFDHYFGTYPKAANLPGEPVFQALPHTPAVNGLTPALLAHNPNAANSANGEAAVNPFRLTRAQAATADQNHAYKPEQKAFNGGKMDLFPASTGVGEALPGAAPDAQGKGQVMGYYDGNTVTALWNYAQSFAMSDNSYNTTFGPSTPGAINLVSGQTNGVVGNPSHNVIADGQGGYTLIGDDDPAGDKCSRGNSVSLSGRNVGDLLNDAGISWGFFEGGFDLGVVNANGSTDCLRSTQSAVTKVDSGDYIPHHQPFQYYASTANPNHLRPTSVTLIGHQGDAANHQYDAHDFFDAVSAGNFPAVSFIKAPAYQDGHAGYSDPLDEQQFVVHVINFLQQQPDWKDTAVVIAYDDSDGWYDHQAASRANASASSYDALDGDSVCNARDTLPGVNGQPVQGRCGYGPRLPLLVVSPWARSNFVDHRVSDQSSILRFVEDNWLHGQRIGKGSFDALAGTLDSLFDFHQRKPAVRRLILDEQTGEPVAAPHRG